jgi:hypothetical protein
MFLLIKETLSLTNVLIPNIHGKLLLIVSVTCFLAQLCSNVFEGVLSMLPYCLR